MNIYETPVGADAGMAWSARYFAIFFNFRDDVAIIPYEFSISKSNVLDTSIKLSPEKWTDTRF